MQKEELELLEQQNEVEKVNKHIELEQGSVDNVGDTGAEILGQNEEDAEFAFVENHYVKQVQVYAVNWKDECIAEETGEVNEVHFHKQNFQEDELPEQQESGNCLESDYMWYYYEKEWNWE